MAQAEPPLHGGVAPLLAIQFAANKLALGNRDARVDDRDERTKQSKAA